MRLLIESMERRTLLAAELVFDINTTTEWSAPQDMVVMDDVLYFTADDGISGRELYRSDGTDAGTWRVADIVPGSEGSAPSSLVVAGTKLFFTTAQGGLWVSDGTAARTIQVAVQTPYE